MELPPYPTGELTYFYSGVDTGKKAKLSNKANRY